MAFRPMFKRTGSFVVCRPIRLVLDKFIEPGTIISAETHPIWRLKAWYNRRLIAEVGCEWANAMLRRHEAKSPKVTEKKEDGFPNLPSGLRIEQTKSWFTIFRGDDSIAKVKGYAALEEWMKDYENAES